MLEISVLIIAICMVLFVLIGLGIAIAVLNVLRGLNKAVVAIEVRLETMLDKIVHTVKVAEEISSEVKDKLEAIRPFLNSIANVGQLLNCATKAAHAMNTVDKIKQAMSSLFTPKGKKICSSDVCAEKGSRRLADYLEWINIVYLLWHQLKKKDNKL